MQKAHLYEAIFLFNHGMDEAVRGLERLKRAPDLDAATVDRTRVLFEAERADMNTHFCNNIEGAEGSDASNFDKRVREFEKDPLDAVKVYEDVQFIEERRRKEGEPPVVRFLTPAEQKRWKRPDSSKSEAAGDKGGNGVSQGAPKDNKKRKSGPQKKGLRHHQAQKTCSSL
jgi:hypothetical protein